MPAPPAPGADASEAPAVPSEDQSVPPVGDWDSPFFAEAYDDDDGFDLELDPRAARYALFAAAADRRAHLARYVVGAVAFCSALCLVALAKAAIFGLGGSTNAGAPLPSASAAAIAPAAESASAPVGEPAAVAASATVALRDPPAEVADPPAPAPPVPEPPAAVASAEPPAAAQPESETPVRAAAMAQPPETADSAREEARQRETCRSALERNRIGAAVEAGERAVELDPTDGEAWLILGAAYQQRGDASNARRCYRACLAQGRRGPRSECAQMLR
jgi:hypothetical protein